MSTVTVIKGIGVGRGVAAARVRLMAPPLSEPTQERFAGDAEAELARVVAAQRRLSADLLARAARAGAEAHEVLTALSTMAVDPAITAAVEARIGAGRTGERAAYEAFHEFAETLAALGGYFGERAGDLKDLAQRIVADLRGVPAPGIPDSHEPFVLVSDDLAPADTATLDLALVKALVTREGGPTSHTAILARSVGLPAIVAIGDAERLDEGVRVLVDAASGTVTVEPRDEAIKSAMERERTRLEATRSLAPGALADGTPVQLLANIGAASQSAPAAALGAEGVGLFRTEFLFLDSTMMPSVDEQVRAYSEALAPFAGRKVVVRALDAGSDKPLPYLTDQGEENPALGRRGLRALLAHPEVLDAQLEALARAQAASDADLWVMAPMVADAAETEQFTDRAHARGLRTAGVMAEVPSIALMAEQVVAAADFVSIGTNDLTQYTMAADRLLGSVASYQDPWHPAVLHLIERLGEASAAAGKPLGVCGEAAADPDLAVVLVGLGVTSLSMSAAGLADVRAELALNTLEQARSKAAAALTARTAMAARNAVRTAY